MESIFSLVNSGSVECVILDFDNTIIVHDGGDPDWTGEVGHSRFVSCLYDSNYYINKYKKKFDLLPGIQELVDLCHKKNVIVNVLTVSDCSIFLKSKDTFIQHVFPKKIEQVFGVSSVDMKVKFLVEYSSYLLRSRHGKGIAFVDDIASIRLAAKREVPRLYVFSPMNVSVDASKFAQEVR